MSQAQLSSFPPPAPTPNATVAISPVPKENSYVGVWTVHDSPAFDIVVFSSGQAISTRIKAASSSQGERGFWRVLNKEFTVFWDSGRTDRIISSADKYVLQSMEPDGALYSAEVPATRVEDHLAGYIGIWRLNKEPDGSYLYLILQSSGRAWSTIAGGTEGKWEVTKEGALCSWPDGWMDLIFTTPGGYQKRSWVGPLPQNTTASDVSDAIRVGSGKFTITP